nr:alpha/beta fold hydrolase [Mangrovivirga halotolerans]
MKYKKLPQNLNFKSPNPEIKFEEWKLEVQDRLSDWPLDKDKLIAGVNSFGWGGTNAHVALTSYCSVEENNNFSYLFPGLLLKLTGANPQVIKDQANNIVERLLKNDLKYAQNICAASLIKGLPVNLSITIAARDKDELIEKLTNLDVSNIELKGKKEFNSHKVCFVFPGQGSQWVGMGKQLMENFPAFKEVIEECNNALKNYCDWDLVEVLTDNSPALNSDISIVQPALFAIEIGLAKLWESFGITPNAIIGHSMGECAAAYIAGALTLNDAAKIITGRSKLMSTVAGQGYGMAVTELNKEGAEKYITGSDSSLSVAVYNSSQNTVIAGKECDLLPLIEKLDEDGIFCKQVKVDVASHSLQMEPLTSLLANEIKSIAPVPSIVPFYSTVLPDNDTDQILNPDYWVKNLRNPVQFHKAVKKALEDEIEIFIEMSPHPVLTQAIEHTIKESDSNSITTYSLLREKDEVISLLNSIGNLVNVNAPLDWKKIFFKGTPELNILPNYPMQRKILVPDLRIATKPKGKNGNRFSGEKLDICDESILIWKSCFSLSDFPFFEGHKVNEEVVLPGTTYVSMVSEIMSELNIENYFIENLKFDRAITLDKNSNIDLQIKASIEDDAYNLTFYYLQDKNWQRTANCTLKINQNFSFPLLDRPSENIPEITSGEFYQITNSLGIEYSEAFKSIVNIHGKNDYFYGLIKLSDNTPLFSDCKVHPALLDNCLQLIFSKSSENENISSAYLEEIEGIKIYDSLNTTQPLLVEISYLFGEDTLNPAARIYIYNMYGDPVAKINKVSARLIPSIDSNEKSPKVYQLKWTEIKTSQKDFAIDNPILVCNEKDNRTKLIEDIEKSVGRLNVIRIQLSDKSIDLSNIESKNIIYLPYSDSTDISETASYNLFVLGQILKQKVNSLTVLTSNASGYAQTTIDLPLRGVWQSGKTAINEHPDLPIKIIDINNNYSTEEIDALVNFMRSEKSFQGVLINSKLYSQIPENVKDKTIIPGKFESDEVIVLTGFKGAAFSFVELLAKSGVKAIALVSRNPELTDEQNEKIKTFRKTGIVIERVACDVSNFNDFTKCLEGIQNNLGEITGFIHAAGLISPDRLDDLSYETIQKILSVKINGALAMDKFDKKGRLRHFIMFSSASVYFGLSGQGAYVSANATLDAIAENRVQNNKPALSVNWGVIKDAGMVADNNHLERYSEAEGFISMKMKEALELFINKYDPLGRSFSIMAINWGKSKDYHKKLAETTFYKSVEKDDRDIKDGDSLLKELAKNISEDKQKTIIKSYLIEGLSKITQLASSEIPDQASFKSMGLDSLMAVQYRNHIEKGFEIKLAISKIWKADNIKNLTDFLINEIAKKNSEVQSDAGIKKDTAITYFGNKTSKNQIIAIHDAGGSSALYASMNKELPEEIGLMAIDLPGRGLADEFQPFETLEQCAVNIANKITEAKLESVWLIGHSMGGAIATEVAYLLEMTNIKINKLIVSSTPALNSYNPERYKSDLPDSELIRLFPHINEIASDDESLKYLMSLLKNDLKIVNKYRFSHQTKIQNTVEVWYATDDDQVSDKQAQNWKSLVEKTLTIRKFHGGHGYLYKEEYSKVAISLILENIKNDLIKNENY